MERGSAKRCTNTSCDDSKVAPSKWSLLVYAWSHESFDELFRFPFALFPGRDKSLRRCLPCRSPVSARVHLFSSHALQQFKRDQTSAVPELPPSRVTCFALARRSPSAITAAIPKGFANICKINFTQWKWQRYKLIKIFIFSPNMAWIQIKSWLGHMSFRLSPPHQPQQ